MSIRYPIIFTLFLSVFLSAMAADKAGNITLADSLARTLEKNPELAAYNWEFRAAEARILQAGLRPNPELSLDIENPTGSGPLKSGTEMENTLTLSQLIELGGKRSARIFEAEKERGVVEWEYQVKRVEILKTTAVVFIEALAAQRRMELAEEVVKVAEEAVTLTEQRVGVGKVSEVEGIRARVAVASARIEVEQARRDAAIARGNLAAQWGVKDADFTGVSGDLDNHGPAPSLHSLRQKLLGNPALAQWTAERERREATLIRQRSLAKPDVTLLAGPRVLGKADNASFVAGFSIPLPWSNRNQGNIAAAQADLEKLTEEKRAAEARSFAALNEAYQRLMGASSEILMLEKSVIPGARDAEKQIYDGYSAGRFTQLEVLDARRTLNTARAQQVRALADYQKSRAELDALTAQPADLPRLPVATPARPAFRKNQNPN